MFKLPETEQEVFNIVAVHLLTQKQKSKDDSGNCKYRFNGLKCAAGAVIPDEAYDAIFENCLWTALVEMGIVPREHKILICSLQLIHDHFDVEEWKTLLIRFADKRKLSTKAIDNLC